MLDDLMVANFGDHLFLVVNGACKADDETHLRKHLADTCSIDVLADRALVALQGVEDATLNQMIALGFRPGETSVADMMFGGGPRHDQGHIDQVESALPAK